MLRQLFSLLLISLLVLPTCAQEATEEALADAPLIAYVNGELLQIENNALVAYPACTPDEDMLGQFYPSNDGSRFLIVTWPKIISQALELFGSLGDIPYGQNLWLCDTTNDSLTRVLAQPGGDADFAGELPVADSIQSRPAWNPDGSKLAWTQLRFSDSQQSLIIFDIATGATTETVLDLPLSPFPVPPDTQWTDMGIMLFVTSLDDVTFANVDYLYIVEPETGAMLNTFQLYSGGETSDFIVDRVFVQQEDGLALALDYYEAGWALMNLQTGEQVPMAAQLERFSAANPDGLRVSYEMNEQFTYDWEILAGANQQPLIGYPLARVVLSPDGTQVAYADASLHLYNADGTVIEIANSDGFADDAIATLLWGTSQATLKALE